MKFFLVLPLCEGFSSWSDMKKQFCPLQCKMSFCKSSNSVCTFLFFNRKAQHSFFFFLIERRNTKSLKRSIRKIESLYVKPRNSLSCTNNFQKYVYAKTKNSIIFYVIALEKKKKLLATRLKTILGDHFIFLHWSHIIL